MQLNNLNTGHFVIIDKISIERNFVRYTEYENTEFKKNNVGVDDVRYQSKVHTFTTIKLKDYLNQSTNFYELCYNTIQSELLTDYEVSTDEYNWLFSGRDYRLTILNSLVLQALKPINASGDLSDLGQLIERVKVQHYGFYKDNDGDLTIAIYTLAIDPNDYNTILPYLNTQIWAEDKTTF